MNTLGLLLLGASARATLLVGIGVGLSWLLRRKGPAFSATLALGTLLGMAGLVALAASPWPRWDLKGRAHSARPIEGQGAGPTAGTSTPPLTADVPGPTPEIPTEPADTRLANAFDMLGRTLMSPAVESERTEWGWPAWVAALALAGVVVGCGRFALGLLAVGALRRSSREVEDADLLELASVLKQRLGVRRPVGVRVAPGLAMPATVGWLRPVILLPEDWTGWDDRERRVVLSHELAHIRRDDYLAGAGAQLSLALQFYHPLAHWLAHRLRLEQELAADAGAASLAGGRRDYLATLARLALRNDPRPVGWAARSFSPPRGTFVRRIEMLRDANDALTAPPSRRSRLLVLGLLGLAVIGLAGLRGPVAARRALAQGQAQPAHAVEAATLDRFIPADAGMVVVIRPAEIVARPEFMRVLEPMLDQGRFVSKGFEVTPAELERVTVVLYDGNKPGTMENFGAIIRTTRPRDWKTTIKLHPREAGEELDFNGFRYRRLGRQDEGGACMATPDDRTVLVGYESVVLRMLAARPGDADRAGWAGAWKGISQGQVAVAVDTSWLSVTLRPMLGQRPNAVGSPLDGFEPLVSKARSYAVGVDLVRGIGVDGLAICDSEADAKQVADTLNATLILARNALASMKTQSVRDGKQVTTAQGLALGLGGPLLEGAVVKADGRTVRFAAKAPFESAHAVAALAPALQAQRAAAKRTQSVNNLKQIGLAFHNYASEHDNRFPAAVMLGPDGKTPYSWRVAILPYIEQNDLFKQYNLNEPWDGPNNRKLLDKMPAIYAHPDAAKGTSPSYFVPTGPHTISPDNQGSSLADITDGTSNTIMAVEAKRDIPWTKPEDIATPTLVEGPKNAPIPPLGGLSPGGFNTLFADGAVRFISESIDKTVLKQMFSRDGAEPISF